jgi:hypothetical protein
MDYIAGRDISMDGRAWKWSTSSVGVIRTCMHSADAAALLCLARAIAGMIARR